MKKLDNTLSNREFFTELFAALLFLGLSAALLMAGFIVHNLPLINNQALVEPLDFKGADLHIALGAGQVDDKALVLRHLRDGNSVIAKSHTSFSANDFPILEFHIKGRDPSLKVAFYWARKEDPQITHFALLPWSGDAPMAYRLANHQDWDGQIIEFGLSIQGELRGTPVVVERLSLKPLGIGTLLFVVWSEWITFEGWQQSSINAILGAPRSALLPPVGVAAAWVGLSILLFGGWYFVRRSLQVARAGRWPAERLLVILMTLFFLPWLVLDAKWQVNLWRQHGETWKRFAGKTHHEQHMRAQDAQIYEYALHLRNNVLPEEPQRIFIMQSEARHYIRLKLMYYLLPHMIYNYGDKPDPRKLIAGDFLLMVNPLPGIAYHERRHLLEYDQQAGHRMNAKRLYQTDLATLYQAIETVWLYQKAPLVSGWAPLYREGRLMSNPLYFVASHPCLRRSRALVRMALQPNGVVSVNGEAFDCQSAGVSSQPSIKALIATRGQHRLASGKRVEINQFAVKTSDWQKVYFSKPFAQPPALYLSLQPGNGRPPELLKVRNVTATGFEVLIMAAEGQNGGKDRFSVAFMALDATAKQDALLLDGMEIPIRIRHMMLGKQWTEVDGWALRLDSRAAMEEEINLLVLGEALFAQVVSANSMERVRVRIREVEQAGSGQ